MSDYQNFQNLGNQGFIKPMQQIIEKMCKDMKFYGVLSIIYGAFSCLTIIGAITGLPILIAGIRMRESADGFKSYSNNNDENALNYAIERLSKMFFQFKLIAIITLVIIGLYLLFIIIIFGVMGTAIFDQLKYI